ncbi:ergot alkaloid biosynthesis protein [Mycolicibacterium chubuense]|uniref:NAD(P)H azoreductase n=1 Tax=Mycolicibacterium chubuense TaxID=1800 RepID=A0A0J6WNB4_MYCCU|nr:NAD(P)H-binding protein [Mycolicibacterium chubuense]KMO84074.1 NAD(P)H azoreductase [Mycolicibacterium chubuense]ORA51965.1 ergot alkaloid biosynthesis protein [Mycolicibacterium chubuense]SPX99902.1 NmrA family protein [Mycolicibacterium chubuense]
MTDPILVTGATGNTGAPVVAGLRERGLRARAASRHPDPADADAVVFDWSDDATFAPALTDVRAVYLVAPTGAADPVPMVRPFLEQATARGIRRVVLLSSSAVERGEPGLGEIHDLVAGLFAEATVLRPSWFMQNFVGDHPLARSIRETREIVTATGDGRLAFIDAADIAAVAVEALTAPEPVSEELVLTGPESLSYAEAAAIASEILGEPVRHVDVSTAELTQRLVAAGYPADFAGMLATLDERIRAGEQDFVTPAVRDVAGRTPTSLRHFLAEH